ncbi:MAG: DUF6283 family protein [Janthinobacterium lividum]
MTRGYMARPCAECPWRTDVAPGQFPAERFIALAHVAYDVAFEQFACHKSQEGDEIGCAGFALAGATHNLGFRLAKVAPGTITTDAPLYPSYRAMAIAHGVRANHPALKPCRDQ